MKQDLVDPGAVADRLKVRRQTVHMCRHRGIMPEPDYMLNGGPVWEWWRIRDWAERTGRMATPENSQKPVD